MVRAQWGKTVDDAIRRDQLRLIYDYIKFHIGLYISTPAALALIADGLGVKQAPFFVGGLIGAIALYLPAGIHAGLFMSRHVNDPWDDDYLRRFEDRAFSRRRRAMHHKLYWLGLGIGLLGLAGAVLRRHGVV